jgi:flagellar basal-body rod modification protein FlgD
MAIDATLPTPIVSAAAVPTASSAGAATGTTSTGLANNFQTFLTLLTTQLQNQNPLDPLDTNQFTQQLVQFAGVEQQLRSNDQLASLVKLQTSAQASEALNFVGATAVVDGATTALSAGAATWSLGVSKPSSVTVAISNSAGQTVYSGNYAMNAGEHQSFVWDGRGNDGIQWPNGDYTISATAKDANGQSVAVNTEVLGVVDSADLSTSPPMLSIGGQSFSVDKIKKVVRNNAVPTPTTPTTP